MDRKYPAIPYTTLVSDPRSHKHIQYIGISNHSHVYSLLRTVATICFALLIGLIGILCWGCVSFNQATQTVYNPLSCDGAPVVTRHNCWPQADNVTQEKCSEKHCCWAPSIDGSGAPHCFYPAGYQLYTVKSLTKTGSRYNVNLVQNGPSGWPNDIQQIAVTVTMESKTKLRIKIFDPNHARYEVPMSILEGTQLESEMDADYVVDIPSTGPFYITVSRRSTGQVLFSTKNAAPLVFSDQFIQLGSHLSSPYIYGLGEHMDNFLLSLNWTKKVMWTRDLPPSPDPNAKDVNLYGVHPFYLNIEPDNNAHGVFLLNSNAMEIELQPSPELTYRAIGGVLDFYIFTGPSPVNVVEQYTEVIGRPFMPPYWSLGFHLSRHGYGGTEVLKRIIKRNRDARMYYDSQWVDSDAMRSQLDWTYDADGIWRGLLDVVSDLHEQGQHFNMLVDPFISINQTAGTYPPYFDGLDNNVFIKNPNGIGNIVGKYWVSERKLSPILRSLEAGLEEDEGEDTICYVKNVFPTKAGWPGHVVFIDFTNPNATSYWTRHAKKFHDVIPYEGHLIDMNEPSNFANGSIHGCPNNTLENPPFVPSGLKQGTLRAQTVCVSARQYLSTHYNVHSLYGHSESIVAKKTLDVVIGKRSFVITRSSYAGTGVYAGHWSGDCNSQWGQLNRSISGMLSFQLFGIPFWGVDICGFGGDTTPEMCIRWFQLGVFYPFMWNHNEIGAKDQDPAAFDPTTQDIIRKALELRYYLIPYLYTMLYRYHVDGTPFIMPLFFLYPESKSNVTYTVTEQFMWGSGLLVTPALEKGVTETKGYLPKDRWYDFYTSLSVDSPGHWTVFDLPLDQINVKIRGGSILPMQTPEVTTTLSRKNKFILYVALSIDGHSKGELYWDDGEALDSISGGKYNLITFQVEKNTLTSTIVHLGYSDEPMVLGIIKVMGVVVPPTTVQIDGKPIDNFYYNNEVLQLTNLAVDMRQSFQVTWH